MLGENVLMLSSSSLTVIPKGTNRLWCFRSRVEVPLIDVERAFVEDDPHGVTRGLRWPGTQFFGWWVAGTFHPNNEKHFWNYAGKAPALAIQLSPRAEFRMLYLSVDDAATEAALIAKSLGARDENSS